MRPIITAFTTMSASMNMLHGDRSRGSFSAWTMAVGDGAAGVAAGGPGAVTSLATPGVAGAVGGAQSMGRRRRVVAVRGCRR